MKWYIRWVLLLGGCTDVGRDDRSAHGGRHTHAPPGKDGRTDGRTNGQPAGHWMRC